MSGILQGLLASIGGGGGPWLYAWGRNNVGQLGDKTTVNRSSPVQIGDLTTWSKIATGLDWNVAIKTDGTLWSWGQNNNGQLGDNTVVNKSSPVQVGALTNWSKVTCGTTHSMVIKTDGTLWGWGRNLFGQLGDGTTTYKSSPVQIGALTDWSKIAAGDQFTIAIKTNGTLWGFGRSVNGRLGDSNDTVYKSSPVQIGALTNWSEVACGEKHTISIKTDGTLWAWGYNSMGRLGDNTNINKSSPVQIGALTTWSQISGGGTHSAAIKTDGTLWTWGGNYYGQLGDGQGGAGKNRSSPTQIGSLSDWSLISGRQKHIVSIKTNKTIWLWGANDFGQLGDNTNYYTSSPVQIGSNTWSTLSVGAASNTTLAIED